MNILKSSILSALLLICPVRAEPPAVLPAPTSDPITEALPLLQASYVDFKALDYKPGDHLTDLIARSNGKISLLPPVITGPIAIITATLPYGVAYWRLTSFTPKKNWGDLAGDLRTMIDFQHVYGAILDLRSNTAPNDFAGAAQVLGFFVPADGNLVKYLPQKGDGIIHLPMPIPDRQFQGPLIVLIDERTTGAAEVLAACLKADGAVVMGRATTGSTSFFEEQPLFSGQILRFAVAPPALADAGHPVVPDIALAEDPHTEKASLMLIRDNHVLDVIEESAERHRMSEAALVQGQDPEWDSYLSSLENGPVLLSLPRIHDTVLISALDSLRAIRLSERPAPTQATANASTPASSSIQ